MGELFLEEAGTKELNITMQIHSCLCKNLMANPAKFLLALPKVKISYCPNVANELLELYSLFFLCSPLLALILPFFHPSNPLSPRLAGLWTRALLLPRPAVKPLGSGVNLMNIPGLACQLFNDFWKGGLNPASHFL